MSLPALMYLAHTPETAMKKAMDCLIYWARSNHISLRLENYYHCLPFGLATGSGAAVPRQNAVSHGSGKYGAGLVNDQKINSIHRRTVSGIQLLCANDFD